MVGDHGQDPTWLEAVAQQLGTSGRSLLVAANGLAVVSLGLSFAAAPPR